MQKSKEFHTVKESLKYQNGQIILYLPGAGFTADADEEVEVVIPVGIETAMIGIVTPVGVDTDAEVVITERVAVESQTIGFVEFISGGSGSIAQTPTTSITRKSNFIIAETESI